MPKTPPGARASSSPRTSCDQPITKIASGRSARTASIVSGALTSEVSTSGAPTSSKERCPERFGSIGPGSVTTPTISAPASAAATRQSWPIMSKLIQTARTGADSTEAPSNREPGAAPRGRALKLPCNSLLQSLARRNAEPDALLNLPCNSLLQGLVRWPLVSGANGHRAPGLALGELPCAEGQRAGDESPDDDPRRLRHADDLHAGEHQRGGERSPERPVGEPDAELAADQHTGDRPDEEPRHRVQVDLAEREVAEAGHPEQSGGVEDVRADDPARRERVDEQHHEPEERPAADRREPDDEAAEEDDQDRRHQRPAAHSCQADEDTDQQAGERELPGHDG